MSRRYFPTAISSLLFGFATACLGLSGCAKPAESDTGLLLHLPLDGGSVADLSGFSRDTDLSGAVPGEGPFADCFFFDGVDDYISVEDFPYGPEFSVSFWFHSSNNEGRAYQYMFSHGPIHKPNSGSYYFVEDDNKNSGGQIKSNLLDENDPDRAEILNTPKGLSDGTWHFFTISVAKPATTVFIDGVPVNSADQGGDAINPRGRILIGSRSDRQENRFYEGYLDDIRVHGRALSAGEVAALFTAGR